jgi:hypothetical protein
MSHRNWKLRTEEAEYGPFELPVLQHWAAEGRFDGVDHVSDDAGATWREAAEFAELGLDWLIRLSEEESSPPVHALTLVQPLMSGEIQPDQEVIQHSTGELFQAADVVTSALIAQNGLLQSLLGETQQALQEVAAAAHGAAAPPPLPEAEPESPDAWRRIIREKDFFEKEAHKWRKFFEDEVERNRLKELDLARETETLRKSEQLSVARVNAAEQARRRAERKLEEMSVSLGGTTSQGSANAAMEMSRGELREQFDLLQNMLKQRTQAFEEVISARDEASVELRRREAQHDEQLRREREQASSQRQQLIQLEQSYQELLTSYREMNERLIQLQSGIGAGMRRGAVPGVPSPAAPATEGEDNAPPLAAAVIGERSRLKLR